MTAEKRVQTGSEVEIVRTNAKQTLERLKQRSKRSISANFTATIDRANVKEEQSARTNTNSAPGSAKEAKGVQTSSPRPPKRQKPQNATDAGGKSRGCRAAPSPTRPPEKSNWESPKAHPTRIRFETENRQHIEKPTPPSHRAETKRVKGRVEQRVFVNAS